MYFWDVLFSILLLSFIANLVGGSLPARIAWESKAAREVSKIGGA